MINMNAIFLYWPPVNTDIVYYQTFFVLCQVSCATSAKHSIDLMISRLMLLMRLTLLPNIWTIF